MCASQLQECKTMHKTRVQQEKNVMANHRLNYRNGGAPLQVLNWPPLLYPAERPSARLQWCIRYIKVAIDIGDHAGKTQNNTMAYRPTLWPPANSGSYKQSQLNLVWDHGTNMIKLLYYWILQASTDPAGRAAFGSMHYNDYMCASQLQDKIQIDSLGTLRLILDWSI